MEFPSNIGGTPALFSQGNKTRVRAIPGVGRLGYNNLILGSSLDSVYLVAAKGLPLCIRKAICSSSIKTAIAILSK
jgi:hypothetical protein